MKLFRIHPFDFLVKPIREEELFRVIGELRELLKERKKIFEYTDSFNFCTINKNSFA